MLRKRILQIILGDKNTMAFVASNRKYTFAGSAALAAMLACLIQPQQAFSQALPWQTGQQQPSQPQDAQPHQHRHQGNSNTPSTPQASPSKQNDQRTLDDRRLNDLATEYNKISAKDKQAIAKLKKLQQDVKTYQASLTQRTYNASDIAVDAVNLENRIAAQIKKLEAKAKAAHSTATSPAPASGPNASPN